MQDKTWEELVKEAISTLREAHRKMDDIAGWSGSAGNWPLQQSLPVVKQALDLLEELNKPSKQEV